MKGQVKIVEWKRENNTLNGNPVYSFTVQSLFNGAEISGKTKPNSDFSIGLPSAMVGREGMATIETTPSGRVYMTDFDTLKKNPAKRAAVKRKTRATTQATAEGYVRRPSQITKKAPSKRLKTRRAINLQTPRGVFPNPAKRSPKYPGAMDVGYPTYAAFSKDAKACGYDPKELLASGEYFKESDGHVLARSMYPKKNPVSHSLREKKIIVEFEVSGQKLRGKKSGEIDWNELASFPDTPTGSKNAIEYAKAYHKISPHLKIRVASK